jgi:hypothetical protein
MIYHVSANAPLKFYIRRNDEESLMLFVLGVILLQHQVKIQVQELIFSFTLKMP